MTTTVSENTFEYDIVHTLVNQKGYIHRKNSDYDKELCMDPEMVIEFIWATQSNEWEKLEEQYGSQTKERFLERLQKNIERRGTLDVLKKGIKDRGCRFDLVYFKPETTLNVEHQDRYKANRFSVIQQLHYSTKNERSIDLVLFINGLPIITSELKNPLNEQNVEHAIHQYRKDRSPKEPLLSPRRCFVHFAVDTDLVYMATKLKGESTKFLPFNRGYENGSGNPPPEDPEKYKTYYLWEEIWDKDMLLDIISDYIVLLEGDEYIFPRYHQLKAVNSMIENARLNGSGHRYLVQHSTGSGKSFTIAWLCNKLSGLHDEDNNRIFDSIIVITDRRVLDQQLSSTMFEFEQVRGTVEWIDSNKKSEQLKQALESNKEIIVVTLQTFPFLVDEANQLSDRNFAIVVDEAHSSQSGETARGSRKVLVSADDVQYEDEMEKDVEDVINSEIEKTVGPAKNISYFAFTATPKQKTLELFGTKMPDGSYEPYHLYSMKQAIEEGFILNPLENYTTFETYFELKKKIEEDPEYDKTTAYGLLKSYVGSSKPAISKKTSIMLDHFYNNIMNRIAGKAKAMVVTSSRANAVRYKLEFDKQINDNNYPFEALVAFSGTVEGNDVYKVYSDYEFTESKMNGFSDSKTSQYFDENDDYRILIVANKFQTGFDQPLLHTMYVDKKLGGVNAVQTLSRLNRIHPEKHDTMVLDFANDAEDIQNSFKDFHVKTTLSEGTDPNKLHDYENELKKFRIFTEEDVEKFAQEYFSTSGTQAKLYSILEPVIQEWESRPEKERKGFKEHMQSFTRLYAFLSHIMTFRDTELEKLYQFSRFLVKKLKIGYKRLPTEILDSVDLESLRISEDSKGSIVLTDKEGELKPISDMGTGTTREEELAPLSEILNELNERFGTEFTEDDRVAQVIEDMRDRLLKTDKLQRAANPEINSKDNFARTFEWFFDEEIENLINTSLDLYKKMSDDGDLRHNVKQALLKDIYSKLVESDNRK